MTTIPNFEDTRDIELITEDDLIERVGTLLQRANTRQVWLMFLDDRARQLPLIMPSYVPRKPDHHAELLGGFFRELANEVGAATIVPTYERRGRADLSEGDWAWLRTLRDACIYADIDYRGPYLCHNGGVCSVEEI